MTYITSTEHDAIAARFWPKVDKSVGCWVWTRAKDRDGYGVFRFPWGNAAAHRLAYELLVGPIPDGMVIDHLCRNTSCVRPDHLEPVTHRENIMRGVGQARMNAAKTHCKNGHAFEAGNIYLHAGKRACRACLNENQRRYQARKRRAESSLS